MSLPIVYSISLAPANLFFDERDRHPLAEQLAFDHVGIVEVDCFRHLRVHCCHFLLLFLGGVLIAFSKDHPSLLMRLCKSL